MRSEQTIRILSLIQAIGLSRSGLTIREMHSTLVDRGFEVSIRTVYRDFEAIVSLPLGLQPEGSDTDYEDFSDQNRRWKITHKSPISQAAAAVESARSNEAGPAARSEPHQTSQAA